MKHQFVSGGLIEVAWLFAYRAVSLHRAPALPGFSSFPPGAPMTPAVLKSHALIGMAAPEVTVEVHLANGLPAFTKAGNNSPVYLPNSATLHDLNTRKNGLFQSCRHKWVRWAAIQAFINR